MKQKILNQKAYKEEPQEEARLSSDRDNPENHVNLLEKVKIIESKRFKDERGFLQKVLSASQCDGDLPRGEVYVTSAIKNEIKGNHYHLKMGEWFCVVKGFGELHLMDPRSKENRVVALGENAPKTVFVPPGLAHAVINTADNELICVAWAEKEHDPDDVYPYNVADMEFIDEP